MSFKSQINKFKDKAEKAATNIFRGTALSLFGRIVTRTPVDTGRLRLNWQSSINRPATNIVEGQTNSDATIGTAKIGDSIFIVNNLPYAQRIENGWSMQAPSGMVAVTVAEFKQIVSKQARQ